MYDKVTLQNNCNSGAPSGGSYYENGAGVFIRTGVVADDPDRQAEFIMKGGTIQGNINNTQNAVACGGGVFILGFAIFTMEGGVIMDNTARITGGGFHTGSRGSFYKTGGIIYGSDAPAGYRNTALNGTGTPKTYGHAVCVAISVPAFQYRNDTVGENDKLIYAGVQQGNGTFGEGEKWDDSDKAFRRMLLAVILPVLVLAAFVIFILRKRYVKKLAKELQEAAEQSAAVAASARPKIDIENMGLTRREREICELLLTDRPLKEIADILKLSYPGANFHARNLYKKLEIENRTELLVRVRNEENFT
jgi:DNA-binding CsgD family transcriptional regulator